MVDMTLFFNIFDMFIICTEAESLSIHLILYDSIHNCFQISCSTAFTNMHDHAISTLSHRICKV